MTPIYYTTDEIRRLIDALRRDCDIRDPQQRTGYLTALCDLNSKLYDTGT